MLLGERDFKRGMVETDEGSVSYIVSRGSGPNLLLIPGSFSDCFVYEDVVGVLPGELEIVIAELRGHGKSWPPPRKGSIEQFAEDVVQVADDVGLSSFYAGGHSIGGMVSLEMGRKWPERIRGIISVEGWTRSQALEEAFGRTSGDTLSDDQRARRKATRDRVTKGWTREEVEDFARIWRNWDGRDFLQNTRIPILEIWGDRGRPRPCLDRLSIPKRRNIQVRWIAGASHSLLLERPLEVAEAASSFISHVEGTASRGR